LVANDKLRKSIGEYGRERAIRTFSLEKYINSISNILLEVWGDILWMYRL